MQSFTVSQAAHINEVLVEQKKTQEAFANLIGCSPVSVNHWRNGKKPISERCARKINAVYPQYPVDWLRGFTEARSDSEQLEIEWLEARNDYMNLEKSVLILATVGNGFEVASPFSDESFEGDRYWESFFSNNLEFSKDGQAVTLSASEVSALVDEVSGYVGMRIDLMLERGHW